MKNFQNISAKVKAILKNDVQAQRSDLYLWSCIIERSECRTLTAYEKGTLVYLLRKGDSEKDGLPNYASVMRSRQKAQADNPELANGRVKLKRAELEKKFRDYFR